MDNGVGKGGSPQFLVVSCGIDYVLNLDNLDAMLICKLLKLGGSFSNICSHRAV